MKTWDEVENLPEFGVLTPEDRAAVHDEWHKSVLQSLADEDPEQIDPAGVNQFIATEKARNGSLKTGQPFDPEVAQKEYAQQIKERTDAQKQTLADYDDLEKAQYALKDAAMARGVTSGEDRGMMRDPRVAAVLDKQRVEAQAKVDEVSGRLAPEQLQQAKEVREALNGKRKVAVLGSDLYTDPALVLDKDDYRKQVMGSDASPEAKALKLASFQREKGQYLDSAVDVLTKGDPQIPLAESFPKFLESKGVAADMADAEGHYLPPQQRRALTQEYLTKMQDRGWFRKIGSAIGTGVASGMLDIGTQAVGMAAMATGNEDTAKVAAELSRAGGDIGAAQGMEGDNQAFGATTAGGVTRIGTGMAPMLIPGGAVGGLARVVGAGAGAATAAAVGASALTAGAQTAGSQFGEVYDALRQQGKTHEEAFGVSRNAAVLSGAVTTALTAMGGANGINALLRQGGKELVKNRLKAAMIGAAKGAGVEELEEIPDEYTSQVISALAKDPNASVSQITDQFAANAPDLMLQIAILGGVPGGVSRFKETTTDPTKAAIGAEFPSMGIPAAAQGGATAAEGVTPEATTEQRAAMGETANEAIKRQAAAAPPSVEPAWTVTATDPATDAPVTVTINAATEEEARAKLTQQGLDPVDVTPADPANAPATEAVLEQVQTDTDAIVAAASQVSPVTTENENPSSTANAAGDSQVSDPNRQGGRSQPLPTDIVSTSDTPSTAEVQPDVGQNPTVWTPTVNAPATATINGHTIVGTVGDSLLNGNTNFHYNWNGKPQTAVVPVSQLSRPLAAAVQSKRSEYTQEQNTRKASRLGLPTEPNTVIDDAHQEINTVLGNISRDTALPPIFRAVAKMLLAKKVSFKGVRLQVTADGRADPGWYDPDTQTISLNLRRVARGGVDMVGTFLHEALHHATLDKVRNPLGGLEQSVIKSLDDIRERLINYAKLRQQGEEKKFSYELGSTHEFISALFTRPDFIDFVASTPDDFAPVSHAGKFRSLLKEVARLVGTLFTGVNVPKGSVMEQAVVHAMALLDETPYVQRSASDVARARSASARGKVESLAGEPERQLEGANMGRAMEMLGASLYAKNVSGTIGKEVFQNAVDAVMKNEGGKARTIWYGQTDPDHFVVADTGSGMNPDIIVDKFLRAFVSGKDVGAGGGFGLAKLAFLGSPRKFKIISVGTSADGRKVKTTLQGTGKSFLSFNEHPPRIRFQPDTDITLAPGFTMRFSYEDVQALPTGTAMEFDMDGPWNAASAISGGMEYVEGVQSSGIKKGTTDLGYGNKATGDELLHAMGYSSARSDESMERTLKESKPYTVLHSFSTPSADVDVIVREGSKIKKTRYAYVPVLNRSILQFSTSFNLNNEVALPEGLVVNIKPKVRAGTSDYPFTTNREAVTDSVKREIERFFQEAGARENAKLNAKYADAVDAAAPIPGTGKVLLDTASTLPPALLDDLVNSPSVQRALGDVAKIQDAILSMLGRKFGPKFQRAKFAGLITGARAYGVHFGKPGSLEPTAIYHDIWKEMAMAQEEFLQIRDNTPELKMGGVSMQEMDRLSYDTFLTKVAGVAFHEALHQDVNSEGEPLARELTFKAGDIVDAVVSLLNNTHTPDEITDTINDLLNQKYRIDVYEDSQAASEFVTAQGGYDGYAMAERGPAQGSGEGSGKAGARVGGYRSPADLLAETAGKLKGEQSEKPQGLSSMFNPKAGRPATGERTLFETPKAAKPIDLATAYQQAVKGKSSQWVPIKDVYAQAKAADPSLTPEAFMAHINEQNDIGGIMVSPVERTETVEAARPFVVGGAGAEMLVPDKAAKSLADETDAEYMAAVESGDVAKQQAMVDAAAKVAGYTVGPVWHGTAEDFTVFDTAKRNSNTAEYGRGLSFFTDELSLAKEYSKTGSGKLKELSGKVYKAIEEWGDYTYGILPDRMKYMANWDNAHRLATPLNDLLDSESITRSQYDRFYELEDNIYSLTDQLSKLENPEGKPRVIRAYLKIPKLVEEDAGDKGVTFGSWDVVNTALAEQMETEGADGFLARNVYDSPFGTEMRADVYAVRSPSQIKSADPITRDKQGNVIPLSQRFNPESNSILYAAPINSNQSNEPDAGTGGRSDLPEGLRGAGASDTAAGSGSSPAPLSPELDARRKEAISAAVAQNDWANYTREQKVAAAESFLTERVRAFSDMEFPPDVGVRVTAGDGGGAHVAIRQVSPQKLELTVNVGQRKVIDKYARLSPQEVFAHLYDVAQEEAIHVMHNTAMFRRWVQAGAKGGVAGFNRFALKNLKAAFDQVNKTRIDLQQTDRGASDKIKDAMLASWNLYHADDKVEGIAGLWSRLEGKDAQQTVFMSEMIRQLTQIKRQDFTTETGWQKFRSMLKQWITEAINSLRGVQGIFRSGMAGDLIQRQLADLEAVLEGKPLPPGPATWLAEGGYAGEAESPIARAAPTHTDSAVKSMANEEDQRAVDAAFGVMEEDDRFEEGADQYDALKQDKMGPPPQPSANTSSQPRFTSPGQFEAVFEAAFLANDYLKFLEALKAADRSIYVPLLKQLTKASKLGEAHAIARLEWFRHAISGTEPAGTKPQQAAAPQPAAVGRPASPPPPNVVPPPKAKVSNRPMLTLNTAAMGMIAKMLGARIHINKLLGRLTRGKIKLSFADGSEIQLNKQLFKDPLQAARTLAHEIGHLFDFMPASGFHKGLIRKLSPLGKFREVFGDDIADWSRDGGKNDKPSKLNALIRAELLALSKKWRGDFSPTDSYRGSGKELYADFVSAILNDPTWTAKNAPYATLGFLDALDQKPEVAQAYDLMVSLVQGGSLYKALAEDNNGKSTSALERLIAKSSALMNAKKTFNDAARGTYRALIGKWLPTAVRDGGVWKSYWNRLKHAGTEKDYNWAQEEASQFAARQTARFDSDMVNAVGNPLKLAGIDADYLQRLQTNNRIIHERRRVGVLIEQDPKKARELLKWMVDAGRLGKERQDEVDAAADADLYNLTAKIIGQMHASKGSFENALKAARRKDAPADAEKALYAFDVSGFMLNPNVHTMVTAEADNADIEKELGPDKFGDLQRINEGYHNLIKRTMVEAHKLGLFRENTWNDVIVPNFGVYVPFMPIDYFTGNVKAGIGQARIGTTRDLMAPHVVGALKMHALIRRMQQQKQAQILLDFFNNAGLSNDLEVVEDEDFDRQKAEELTKQSKHTISYVPYWDSGEYKWVKVKGTDAVTLVQNSEPDDLAAVFKMLRSNTQLWRLNQTVLSICFTVGNTLRNVLSPGVDFHSPKAALRSARQILSAFPYMAKWVYAKLAGEDTSALVPASLALEHALHKPGMAASKELQWFYDKGILQPMPDDASGRMTQEELARSVMGALSAPEFLLHGVHKAAKDLKWYDTTVKKYLHTAVDFMAFIGAVSEAAPKIAAAQTLLEKKDSSGKPKYTEAKAAYLATLQGIPRPGVAGAHNAMVETVLMYFRVAVQAMRKNLIMATLPETRAGYLMSHTLFEGAKFGLMALAANGTLDAIIAMAAAAAAGGDDDDPEKYKQVDFAEAMNRASTYQLSHGGLGPLLCWVRGDGGIEPPWGHKAIPADWTPIMPRLPGTEVSREADPLAYYVTSKATAPSIAPINDDIFWNDFARTLLPGVNPAFEVVSDATSILGPTPPRDSYRGREKVEQRVWDEGYVARVMGLAQHNLQQFGIPGLSNNPYDKNLPGAWSALKLPGVRTLLSSANMVGVRDAQRARREDDLTSSFAQNMVGEKFALMRKTYNRLKDKSTPKTPQEEETYKLLGPIMTHDFYGTKKHDGLYDALQAYGRVRAQGKQDTPAGQVLKLRANQAAKDLERLAAQIQPSLDYIRINVK